MKEILMYIWQLPQMLVGLVLRLFYKGNDSMYEDAIVRRSTSMLGGIALGKYIIVSQWSRENTIKHEYGHCRQSKMLGWLYLLVIGLPSLIWSGMYGTIVNTSKNGYYKFYTEKWADKLGGVVRE